MVVEIDQSIKIEQTHADTIIGIANSKQVAVCITRQIKRKLEKDFRKVDRRRLFSLRTFIAGCVLGLEYAKYKNLSDVVIDIEYVGQERRLRSIFVEMWSRRHDSEPDVSFRLIGKGSKAHEVCWKTQRGKRKPDIILTYGDIKNLALSRLN